MHEIQNLHVCEIAPQTMLFMPEVWQLSLTKTTYDFFLIMDFKKVNKIDKLKDGILIR